jgi:hypothetical protein
MGNAESKRGSSDSEKNPSPPLSAAEGASAEDKAAAGPAKKGGKPKHDVVFVDDDPEEIRISVGFSPSLFIGKEWSTLKKFCNARGLHQRHLNQLFKRYLSKEDVYLRDFRVRTLDVKEELDDMSRLYREITEIFIPMIYQKEFTGLEKCHSLNECTFARFVIITYIFLAQPYPDLFFELFCLLRQRFNLKTSATFYAHNMEQMVSVMCEELEPSHTRKYMMATLQDLPKDKEFSFGSCIQMALKYPLMFYMLKRFRQHIRRIFLGDKFWNAAKSLKTKLPELGIKKGFEVHFRNEHTARLATCRALISDVYNLPVGKMVINSDPYPEIEYLDASVCNHLKKSLGYKLAKKLILESELPYTTENQAFLTFPVERGDEDSRFHDNLSDQDLKYNNATGRRAWVCKYVHHEDHSRVLKEIDIDRPPETPDDWGGDEDDEHG